jgi:beta-lactamase class A
MISRRFLVGSIGASAIAATFARPARAAGLGDLGATFARIEGESGGRLGVAVLDTGGGARTGHRADERFPMCSTFKMLLSAAVLARVDAGRERLDRRVRYHARDLITYSPTTQHHVADGMTIAELCEAAVTLSDNTAANLLLASIGGPAGFTAYARSLGDRVTRLDRNEPTLNESLSGDPRDTTTPAAMLDTLQKVALGTALSPGSRELLVGWLVGNRTGDARLRAGLPGWRVGDKTGTGARGSTNDIAVAWPPQGAPLVIIAYLTATAAPSERRESALAAIGRAVAAALG